MPVESSYRGMGEPTPYRASLHNHTFKDGAPTARPSVALGMYRQCGIPVVAITEHDRRIHTDRDITAGNVPWTDEHWAHDYEDGVLLRGFEASFPDDHVNVLGVDYFDVAEDPCTRTGTVHGEPGDPGYVAGMQDRDAVVVLNHPAAWNDAPEHVLGDENLSTCDGIEIYNGSRCADADRAVATPLWDACLSRGERFWGLANSDNHRYDFTRTGRPTNGWNVLYLEELTPDGVLAALRSGRFYASSGLEVDEITVDDESYAVTAAAADTIRFIGDGGEVLETASGGTARYPFTGSETYVRVECEADSLPHPDSDVPVRAWLQPAFPA